MHLAIVHDWLVTAGGGENVLSEALKTFPGTSVHSLIDKMSPDDHARLGIPQARTTAMQRIPGIERSYRNWLPLMPAAMRTLDVRSANTVLSISHAVAKAPRVRADQKLLCLCLSPMRYAWDLRDQYLAESGNDRGVRRLLAGALLDHMREWDRVTSARVDSYASISKFIADRVKRAYGRESVVIYPPVDTEFYSPGNDNGSPANDNGELTAHGGRPTADGAGYYVTASRFVPYKRVDLIVRAFAADGTRRLVVIGDGPDDAKVRAAAYVARTAADTGTGAAAANITFVGHANRAELRALVRGARAFVFAAEEDFGIAPVEAQACGVPVIAYGKGGALETIVADGAASESIAAAGAIGAPPTGVFFGAQTAESLLDAVVRFERTTFSSAACRANAERFSAARFRAAMISWVTACGEMSVAARNW